MPRINTLWTVAATLAALALAAGCGKKTPTGPSAMEPAPPVTAPAEPTDPPAEPTEPPAEPTEPPGEPIDPTGEPIDPTGEPTADGDEELPDGPPRPLDVHFVPTPHLVIDKMLEFAAPKKGELLYDLGCGDGRIVIAAAQKYGVRAIGYDLDPKRVAEARANVEAAGVGDLVTIEHADVFTLDLSAANVITLYLLPDLNVRLIPQLEKLKPGSRIVSHDFDMRGMVPKEVVTVYVPDSDGEDLGEHEVYFWTIPFEREED